MAVAVDGQHYTAMAAAEFRLATSAQPAARHTFPSSSLPAAALAATFAILSAGLAAATVDFFEIEYRTADHTVARKTLYTASLLFSFRDQVPNEDILVNPLGLTISYFREDEAFTK